MSCHDRLRYDWLICLLTDYTSDFVMDSLYLLEHACGELHCLMVLLLQHIHVEVIQVVVSVIIHPAFVQLKQQGQEKSYQLSAVLQSWWIAYMVRLWPVSLVEPIAGTHLGVLHWLREPLLPHGSESQCHWSELWSGDLFRQCLNMME